MLPADHRPAYDSNSESETVLSQLVSASVLQTMHNWVLQDWLVEPTQSAPHSLGEGLLQLLVCVPPPHSTLHVLQDDHPPFTGVQETTPSHHIASS